MTIIDAGYVTRAAETVDFPALARFIRFYDTTVGDYSDSTEEDLWEFQRMERFDLATDSWLAQRDGDIVAFGLAWRNAPGVVYSFSMVHPAHTGRGLGTICCRNAEARSSHLLEEPHGVLRSFVDVKDEAGRALLTGRGYKVVRRQYTMHRTLPAEAGPELPAGISVRTARPDEGPLLHALIEETFADHWGYAACPFEEFHAGVLRRADTEPGLWFIAEEGNEPVAVLIATLEDSTGWVADLGVRAPWRGRGIGRALLHTAFDEFTRRGATEAALGVDAGNATGAVRLYERAGMTARKMYESYELPIAARRRGSELATEADGAVLREVDHDGRRERPSVHPQV